MRIALKEAVYALKKNEVPIGAVLTYKDSIIYKGFNLVQTLLDVTAHVEIQAIKIASSILKDKYLYNCNLYVTLEPCIMCSGAIFLSKINKLIFGAYDLKNGFLRKRINLHPNTVIVGGILNEECKIILKKFFQKKRCKKNIIK